MIKWNKVTWYSRAGAIILFLIVIPVLAFYIGIKYDEATFDWQLPLSSNVKIISHNNKVIMNSPTVTGWKVYENKIRGFNAQYPSDWKIVNTGMDEPAALVEIIPNSEKDIYSRANSFRVYDMTSDDAGKQNTDWSSPIGNSYGKTVYFPESKLKVVMTASTDNKAVLDKILSRVILNTNPK